jgi:hypothetical protein
LASSASEKENQCPQTHPFLTPRESRRFKSDGNRFSYARPLFLRIVDAIEVTSTFKHMKSDLVRQGFDPAAVPDQIYLDHPELGAFVPVDAVLFDRIQARSLRF